VKFVLTIELGNDAMQTYGDIASALIRLGKDSCDNEPPELVASSTNGGNVYDQNGNRVGKWKVVRS